MTSSKGGAQAIQSRSEACGFFGSFAAYDQAPTTACGTSMVATTFAADTPLAVTGMVARGGIAGNWLWWNFVASTRERIEQGDRGAGQIGSEEVYDRQDLVSHRENQK